MFVERLNKDQVYAFLKQVYPNYSIAGLYLTRDKDWSASVCNERSTIDYSWNDYLSDFMASRNENEWIEYLYHIFGEEYKRAYLTSFLEDMMEDIPECFGDVALKFDY